MHIAYNSRNLRNVKMWKMIKFVQAMNTTWKLNYTWQECVLCMWALSTNDIIEIKKKNQEWRIVLQKKLYVRWEFPSKRVFNI